VSVSNPEQAPRQAAVSDQGVQQPQLLFFYSATSVSSRRTEGFLAQVLQRRRNHQSFRLRPIEVAKRPDLVERFQIDAIPALFVVADKQVRARLDKPRGCAEISQALAPWLK
jgi:thioredoxin-like negative regulator of GroEL